MKTGDSRSAVRAIADLALPILLLGVVASALDLGVLNPNLGTYSIPLGLGLGALMVCYYLGFMIILFMAFRLATAGMFVSLLCSTTAGAASLWTVNLVCPGLVVASFARMMLVGLVVTLAAAVLFGMMILVGLMEPMQLAWLPRRRPRL
jgi:hypothetical protein